MEKLFFDRDLSWLSFNYRVLMEARDLELPLYERLKFLAIYSSNLDEFFKVRVASIQSLLSLKKKKRKKLGLSPKQLIQNIGQVVFEQQEEFGRIFRESILPELHANGINLIMGDIRHPDHLEWVREFFSRNVLPFVHPEILMKGKIKHFLRENAVYLALRMTRKTENDHNEGENETEERSNTADNGNKRSWYATVLIPTHYFSRFIEIPTEREEHTIVFLDDIIRVNLDQIFPGFEIEECYSIKLSRSAELNVEDEFEGDLVEKIKKNLALRQVGAPARCLHDKAMPERMLKYLRKTYRLKKWELAPGGRYHNFRDFFRFPNPLSPTLERERLKQLPHRDLDNFPSIYDAIDDRDHVLHFPYQTYDYVLRFFNEAASDPHVTEIQTTQYRVARDSAIVKALIRAAQAGKKVSVFVEIKARFDEASNLRLAEEMQKAGVKVIYSLPGLKVHAKIALVTRLRSGKHRHYAYLSTGNFNETTASIYADHGLLTSDQSLIMELERIFDFLTDGKKPSRAFENLLIAQFNLKSRLFGMIDREIELVRAGKVGHITLKINNLEEHEMIEKLSEASQAGVRIDLIVRGICCLRPGVKGLTENIHARRIVDQFLEHARVFVFHNNGKKEMYMGSADLMDRNLNRRIEVVFPIRDDRIFKELEEILDIQLRDNTKAVHLGPNMENLPIESNEPPVRAQLETYHLVLRKHTPVEAGEI